jgi:hypothetical protein
MARISEPEHGCRNPQDEIEPGILHPGAPAIGEKVARRQGKEQILL